MQAVSRVVINNNITCVSAKLSSLGIVILSLIFDKENTTQRKSQPCRCMHGFNVIKFHVIFINFSFDFLGLDNTYEDKVK